LSCPAWRSTVRRQPRWHVSTATPAPAAPLCFYVVRRDAACAVFLLGRPSGCLATEFEIVGPHALLVAVTFCCLLPLETFLGDWYTLCTFTDDLLRVGPDGCASCWPSGNLVLLAHPDGEIFGRQYLLFDVGGLNRQCFFFFGGLLVTLLRRRGHSYPTLYLADPAAPDSGMDEPLGAITPSSKPVGARLGVSRCSLLLSFVLFLTAVCVLSLPVVTPVGLSHPLSFSPPSNRFPPSPLRRWTWKTIRDVARDRELLRASP